MKWRGLRRGAAAGGTALLLAIGARGAAAQGTATPEQAKAYVQKLNAELKPLVIKSSTADWIKATYITDDTEHNAAAASDELMAYTAKAIKQSLQFSGLKLDQDSARMIYLLRTATSPPPSPADPAKRAELAAIVAKLEGMYGKGKWCRPEGGGKCRDLEQLTELMAKSRNYDELLDAWAGWHTIARPMKPLYARFVELSNEGAKQIGYADTGELWRSGYDMKPVELEAETDRLWNQVEPLYDDLHCYVRAQLARQYGAKVPLDGPIPAHLLGNMWAQEWNNVYELAIPYRGEPSLDVDAGLKRQKYDPVKMVRRGEAFFTSLGLDPLPKTFWERSMFTKPRDRDVVCHASAWGIDYKNDLRIKMCIEPNAEDFATIHHELGHNFYQRAYNDLPPLFQNSANDGFHEAIGDTIALSVTPEYLQKIGLIDSVPPASGDIALLLQRSLEKIAFLPFGLLVDQWRWKVFSGEIKPADYNKTWWELRRKYQGIAPPVARSEDDFDPGAKYHVAANVPYTRYFLAFILQFQFHRALCKEAGYTGPLNRCSIYGNKAAGAKLAKMLAMGESRPWPDALEALTGQRQMDASAILDYFAPLKKWLDEQNAGHKVGWN